MLLNFLKKISFWGLLSLMGPKMGPDGSFSSFMEKKKTNPKSKKNYENNNNNGSHCSFFSHEITRRQSFKIEKKYLFWEKSYLGVFE